MIVIYKLKYTIKKRLDANYLENRGQFVMMLVDSSPAVSP